MTVFILYTIIGLVCASSKVFAAYLLDPVPTG